MKNRNYKTLVFILLLIGSLCVVGGTIAYYTSSDTFTNEFNTGTYVIQTQENFESPDDWTPGTTTPKTVIAINKGTTPAAVRVKLTPIWVDSDGITTLPLTDGINEAAIINFSTNSNTMWTKEDDWYYYVMPINKNESTTSLLKSVTFNPNVNISATHDCVEDQTTHATTCTTETTGYSEATYKLQVDIETCQYDKYQEIWGTSVNIGEPNAAQKLLASGELVDIHDANRFIGGDPKNYVTFNDETWRILGVYDGKLKLINMNNPISNQIINNSNNIYPTWYETRLKETLNITYYESLSSDAKEMISDDGLWYIGSANYGNTAINAYNFAKQRIDSDKVGLIATYEYLYTPSIDSCYEISGYNYGYSNGCGNPQNNWLVSNVTYWTLTPHHSENRVNYVASSGNIYDENTNIVHAVYPVIYLKPTVKILSGTGEVGSNYILG